MEHGSTGGDESQSAPLLRSHDRVKDQGWRCFPD